ncbi:hypothetical protein QL285_045950 [Trifolium repens]|nr:hypothetical protein QL285_045950 [Trifolium repens]
MDIVEQENVELREEVATLRAKMERVSARMDSLVVAQNQPPPLSTHQATIISEIGATPVSAVPISDPQHTMPEGYPWGMPLNVMEGFHFPTSGFPTSFVQHANANPQPGITIPQVTVSVPPLTMTFPTSIVHTAPVHHKEPAENVGACVRMDDFQAQFDKMQLEIKALRGKDLFGKDAHDLFLVLEQKRF